MDYALIEENARLRRALEMKEAQIEIIREENLDWKRQQMMYWQQQHVKASDYIQELIDEEEDEDLMMRYEYSEMNIIVLEDSYEELYEIADKAVAAMDVVAYPNTYMDPDERSQQEMFKEWFDSLYQFERHWNQHPIRTDCPDAYEPYTLGSKPWRDLLSSYARGNRRKMEFMSEWLRYILVGGSLLNPGFKKGVELKHIDEKIFEQFQEMIIPKIVAARPDISVRVATTQSVETSLKILVKPKQPMRVSQATTTSTGSSDSQQLLHPTTAYKNLSKSLNSTRSLPPVSPPLHVKSKSTSELLSSHTRPPRTLQSVPPNSPPPPSPADWPRDSSGKELNPMAALSLKSGSRKKKWSRVIKKEPPPIEGLHTYIWNTIARMSPTSK